MSLIARSLPAVFGAPSSSIYRLLLIDMNPDLKSTSPHVSARSSDGRARSRREYARTEHRKGFSWRRPRRNHAAVNIQGQTPQLLLFNGFTYDLTVDFHQSRKRFVRKALQPAAHAAFARQTQQTTKPLHQRIFTKIVQMIEPSATNQNQYNDHQNHVDGTVVSSQYRANTDRTVRLSLISPK
jgi:hypothetical protein